MSKQALILKNKLYILISTIDERILNLKTIMQSVSENVTYVISHQLIKDLSAESQAYIGTLMLRSDVIYSQLAGKGVAKNRNNTLKFIQPSAICLILDDDVALCAGAFENVMEAFEANPQADSITFKILDPDGNDYKVYPKQKRLHSRKSLTGIGTTEIAFRSNFVLEKQLKFDERFGPGADRYPMGEDFIFAMELYGAGAKMLFIPIAIAVHPAGSTGGSMEEKIIFARGAVFARVFSYLSYIFDLYFSLKHRKRYSKHYTVYQYFQLMVSGSYDFLKRKKQ